MASLWGTTRRGAGSRRNLFRAKVMRLEGAGDLSIPAQFRCPISLELMRDPVTLPTGITYDRHGIETWLDMGHGTCPVTNGQVDPHLLVPNHALRRMIQDWCVAHREYGVERIPTPRIPATAAQVEELLSGVAAAARRGDGARCREAVARVRGLARESERNRRCVVSNGAAAAMSAAFVALARGAAAARSSAEEEAKEEILAALAGMFPLGEEACAVLRSAESLRSVAWIAGCGGLAGRLNAVLVVKELVRHGDGSVVDAVAGAEGMAEALVKLIREPISPQATKASLVAVFYLLQQAAASSSSSSDEGMAAAAGRLVDMGLVPLVLEMLAECSDRSTTEKALGVLDAVCGSAKGRGEACAHALTVPVLVKKIFRVSEVATGFAVSALWKLLCRNNSHGDGEGEAGAGCLVEALQVGAFQKLLLLLQVGCGEATKEKAGELLKLLNASRGRVECIDSADFKGLKRPFV